MKRDNPDPHFYIVNKTFEVVSEESAEAGEAEETGFEFENERYDSLRDLIHDNRHESWVEWSSSHPTGRDWLISEPEQDYNTGDYTSYGLHIKRSDKKALSRREIRAISSAYGVRLPKGY